MTIVADIAQSGKDSSGAPVVTVYAKRPPLYAVYQTDQRVLVQYSDDPAVEGAQRPVLAQLNPLRSDVNGLIDGWRKRRSENLRARAARYDKRIADALIEALEGDPDDAKLLLQSTKDQLAGERTSWAQFQYLIVASTACLVSIVLLSVANRTSVPPPANLLLLGAGAGAMGAFFSIAIAIHTRTVLTDLYFWNNAADAVLRVIIGEIAGGILTALFLSKSVSFSLGGAPFAVNASSWVQIALVGFVGGFSERLIPDLLSKAVVSAVPDAGNPPPGVPSTAQAKGVLAAANGDANALNADLNEDACLSATGISQEEAVPDEKLPK